MWRRHAQLLLAPRHVRCMSRIGKLPVPLPASVKVDFERYPVEELRPIKPFSKSVLKYVVRNRPNKASFAAFGEPSQLRVEGPLGALRIPIHSFCSVELVDNAVRVNPMCGGNTKLGKTLWGTTRSYIDSAVYGVSQGYQKELELQGVGYKARVEPFDPTAPHPPPTAVPTGSSGKGKKQAAEKVIDRPLGSTKYMSRFGAQAGTLGVAPEGDAAQPKELQALVLRVGFSHEVRMVFPPHLTVETPTPTTVLISGIDKQQVGQAAKRVKLIRKPDAYKGKGIRYAGTSSRPTAAACARAHPPSTLPRPPSLR